MIVKLKKHLRKYSPKDKIHIYYMFYDEDSDRLSKKIKHILIYSEKDFNKIIKNHG